MRRSLATFACRLLLFTLPPRLQSWGRAIDHEVAGIPDDTEALMFALGSLCGLAPRIIAFHLLHPFVALAGGDGLSSGGKIAMDFYDDAAHRPRSVGIVCAVGAVLLGLAYMALAGAPMRYLGINAGALALGLVMLAIVGRASPAVQRWPVALTLAMSIGLLATALLGDRVEGAARWVQLGPLSIQLSLVLLPMMIVGFARSRSVLSTAGIIIAAAAMAIQPDRAMAGMLAAGLAVLAVMRPDRHVLPAFASGIAGFAVTLVRPDTLPAVPYVDQILYSSFGVHPFAGLAVLGGSVLLIVPAIVGRLYDADNRQTYSVFGAVWLVAVIASALGNYPTPIVGCGGSAVLGYVLSLTMLPKVARACLGAEVTIRVRANERQSTDRQLCVGVAYSG